MKRYSIIHDLDDRTCLICGSTYNTHIHEVYYGRANRRLSIEYGLCVRLCPRHHNEGDASVHSNKVLDNKLKANVQNIAMKHYGWTEQDFIRIFGKSYIHRIKEKKYE